MSNDEILSYEWFDTNYYGRNFYFQNLEQLPQQCKEPEKCKLKCYTFRKSTDIGKVREDFETAVSNLGYQTKDEFESGYKAKHEWVERIKLKSLLNPFDKNKNRDQKLRTIGLYAFFIAPFVLIPVSLVTNSHPVSVAGMYTAGAEFLEEAARRAFIASNKREMREMEKKFNDPNRDFFCKLKDAAPQIDVDTVYVEDAHKTVESARVLQLIDVKFKKGRASLDANSQRVNDELFRIYQTCASQPKT